MLDNNAFTVVGFNPLAIIILPRINIQKLDKCAVYASILLVNVFYFVDLLFGIKGSFLFS